MRRWYGIPEKVLLGVLLNHPASHTGDGGGDTLRPVCASADVGLGVKGVGHRMREERCVD